MQMLVLAFDHYMLLPCTREKVEGLGILGEMGFIPKGNVSSKNDSDSTISAEFMQTC